MIDINFLWIGGQISDMELMSLRSHLMYGHRCTLWCYEAVANIPNGVILADGNEILSSSEIFAYKVGEGTGSFSAFSNLFRYKLLYERGGWWCDTDVVCFRPFDFGDYVFASERMKNGLVAPTTCVIKAPARSDLMKFCWETANQIDRETVGWGTIGPKLLSEGIFKFGLGQYVESPNVFCPINWFDVEEFPPIKQWPPLTQSTAVHLWHEMWRRKSIDKDGDYPGTLYQRLKVDFLLATEQNRH